MRCHVPHSHIRHVYLGSMLCPPLPYVLETQGGRDRGPALGELPFSRIWTVTHKQVIAPIKRAACQGDREVASGHMDGHTGLCDRVARRQRPALPELGQAGDLLHNNSG